ncbi:hypothetical protein SJ093_18240 [Citrobacter freundii]|uniref:hypothetical protein n=1 Tax=Citrobacter freundii TaxID=546 RepID=UPI000FD6D7EE|nr:hypothetical protein [Citrobacter freundii]HED4020353.1 hypothetical protein [Escherichia coli]MCT4736238.1 hypothetical protein [Citrobacter freundii]MDT7068129.1 hypothetical protein [Citrobacter freundii]MDT7083173.1 hypothetical protein [Citrobacter freundii]MDT7137460.1 hypothetical protein [Citrobacter freundii]
MSKKLNLNSGLAVFSIFAIIAGLLIAWGLYYAGFDYPYKPLFIFIAAPAALLIFLNMQILNGDLRNFWSGVLNMMVLLAGVALPIVIEYFLKITMEDSSYFYQDTLETLNKNIHYALVIYAAYLAVIRNISLIFQSGTEVEIEDIQKRT